MVNKRYESDLVRTRMVQSLIEIVPQVVQRPRGGGGRGLGGQRAVARLAQQRAAGARGARQRGAAQAQRPQVIQPHTRTALIARVPAEQVVDLTNGVRSTSLYSHSHPIK